jgi:hypothetical protein
MARETVGGADQAIAAKDFNLTAAGSGPWVAGLAGVCNATVAGTFVATIVLEASPDGGTTVFQQRTIDGAPFSLTAPDHFQFQQFEPGWLYRLTATAWTSGTANCRLAGGRMPQ